MSFTKVVIFRSCDIGVCHLIFTPAHINYVSSFEYHTRQTLVIDSIWANATKPTHSHLSVIFGFFNSLSQQGFVWIFSRELMLILIVKIAYFLSFTTFSMLELILCARIKMIHSFEVKIVAFVWKIKWWERECILRNLHLQGHLSIIKEPILWIETNVVESLHEWNVRTNVELGLELRTKLYQEFLLFDKAELSSLLQTGILSIKLLFFFGFFLIIIVVKFWLHLRIYLSKNGIDIVTLLQIFAQFVIFVRIKFETNKIWVLEARYCEAKIKVSQRINVQHLQLTVMFQL